MTQLPGRTMKDRDSVPASSDKSPAFSISISLMRREHLPSAYCHRCRRDLDATELSTFSVSHMVAAVFLVLLDGSAPGSMLAQTSTGGINGTISDQSGANIPGAVITLTSASTGATRSLTASSSGTYAITSLEPGEYDLQVSATGFQTLATQVRVLVGQIANGNYTLAPGQQVTQVEVGGASSDQQVNTTQPTIQDALTAKQIDNTPLNGRNFLDLAQLTPGVQIQDGGNFDPTKNGLRVSPCRAGRDDRRASKWTVSTSPMRRWALPPSTSRKIPFRSSRWPNRCWTLRPALPRPGL